MQEQNVKIELSEQGKELLSFVKNVQDGVYKNFEMIDIYKCDNISFETNSGPVYKIWGTGI